MLHIRCGHDIEESLRAAGIPGDFLAYTDPVCQGPTPAHQPEPIQLQIPHSHQPATLASNQSGSPSSRGTIRSR